MTQARDQIFLQIIKDMTELIVETTRQCSSEVFRASSAFVEEDTHKKLESFYQLYFTHDDGAQEGEKESMNRDIDRLFDQASASAANGEEIVLVTTPEEDQRRLGFSALQKELETLISMDNDVRDKIQPVLSSMQFEDAVTQRLEHVVQGWEAIIQANCDESKVDGKLLADSLTSVEETKLFYEEVLHEEAPEEGGLEGSSVLMF